MPTKSAQPTTRPHFQPAITRTKISRTDGKWTVSIFHPQTKLTAQATAETLDDARLEAREKLESKFAMWQRS